mmetsp:Transcript_5217/g.10651  ORF Transcript_5217/g.10651 Transcript_5217/m.10651 type:complete len:375 (-) Transcript_5217:1067-2191(-)
MVLGWMSSPLVRVEDDTNRGWSSRVSRGLCCSRVRFCCTASVELSDSTNIPFAEKIKKHGLDELRKSSVLRTLQINIGLTCNMACFHCHVASSPSRKETMSGEVADRILALTQQAPPGFAEVIDITGGAPEMHAQFRRLVQEFRAMGRTVMDRCNLTILLEPGQNGLARFLADNQVKIVASMPCYSPDNVEAQRGEGVFEKSIAAIQLLNSLGYGIPSSGLELDLVYNPVGPFLPPQQSKLENDYKKVLLEKFGITFNRLLCITNMPIKKFAQSLRASNNLQAYMDLLVESFNPATTRELMCRSQIHVAYDGRIYDCDFNYALGMGAESKGFKSVSIFDVESLTDLANDRIIVANHCYGCTAGFGSSCGGGLDI